MKITSKSHILVSRYLNGDKTVTLEQIEHQEFLDNVEYSAAKFSYNNKYLYKLFYGLFFLWHNLWK